MLFAGGSNLRAVPDWLTLLQGYIILKAEKDAEPAAQTAAAAE